MDQEELKKSYEKIHIQTTATSHIFELQSHSQLQQWDDSYLTELRHFTKFRISACNIEESERILCRFFNFYFHGIVRL